MIWKKLALVIKIYSSRNDSKLCFGFLHVNVNDVRIFIFTSLQKSGVSAKNNSFGDYVRLDANVWLFASGTPTFLLCLPFVKIIISLRGCAEYYLRR